VKKPEETPPAFFSCKFLLLTLARVCYIHSGRFPEILLLWKKIMQHIESMGDKWVALGVDPKNINGVINVTLELGGTRPVWNVKDEKIERMVMAWPNEGLLRSSVTVAGAPEGQLSAVAVAPLMEGFANEMKFIDAHGWKGGHAGELLAQHEGAELTLCFYDPLYFRDVEGLAKDSKRKFYLSGLCYGMRKALLDELTITEGPRYEQHAKEWMIANPTKTRLDVPALKIPLKGVTLIDATDHYCEYQCRASIFDVDSFDFGPGEAAKKIYRFGIALGNPADPVYVIVYAPADRISKNYIPQDGDDVDMIFWMQGRIADDPHEEGHSESIIPAPNAD